ncbi:MAG: FecR family protein [Spirochaetota bacterium]|jgi:hypothetical protein|nr:FecR family protein [Spirochaetota bacterium]
MRSSSRDLLFFAVILIIFVVFGYALYADLTARIEKTDGEPIGELIQKRRVAQRQYDGQVIWQTIPERSIVYVNDSIYTGVNSEAWIDLDDGTRINLDEETLIKLVRTGRGLGLDFKHGGVSKMTSGREEEKDTGFQITSGDVVLSLGKANAVFRRGASSDDFTVDVVQGEAILEKRGMRVAVAENEQASVNAGTAAPDIRKVRFSPTGGGGLVLSREKTVAHTLSWQTSEPMEVVLELARNTTFSLGFVRYTTRDTAMTLNMSEGNWYWRLRDPGGNLSRTERTLILPIQEVQPLSPERGARITYLRKLPLVTIQWSGDDSANSYTLEISRNADFSDGVFNLRSRVNSIAIDALPQGTYWWRVQAHYAAAPQDPPACPPSYFVIEQVDSAPPIEVSQTGTISTLQLESEQVAVSWRGNPEYAQYRVELAKTSDFSTPVYSENTTANFSRLRSDLPEDTYHWRVTALDAQGTVLARSPGAVVEVRSPRPVILVTPGADAALVSDGESLRVNFSWNDPNRANKARFELANDASFLALQRNLVINGNTQGITLPPGEYFWRVTVLNAGGAPAADTASRKFFISATLPSPVLRTPAPGTVVDMRLQNSIRFSWDRVPRANAYRISLYQYTGNALQKRSEDRVEGTDFVFTRLHYLDRGRFMWEVEALLLENAKIRTTSNPARSDFSVLLPELKKAAIVSPQVIYVD